MYAILLVFAVLFAFADPKPFLALLEMLTFSAGGIGDSFGVSFVMTASILHHRDERLALFGEQRLSDKIGIDDRRLAQRTLPISFLVKSVPQFK